MARFESKGILQRTEQPGWAAGHVDEKWKLLSEHLSEFKYTREKILSLHLSEATMNKIKKDSSFLMRNLNFTWKLVIVRTYIFILILKC